VWVNQALQELIMGLHFLPKAFGLISGKGINWKSEKTSFYDDQYIPIHPSHGAFP